MLVSFCSPCLKNAIRSGARADISFFLGSNVDARMVDRGNEKVSGYWDAECKLHIVERNAYIFSKLSFLPGLPAGN